MTVDSTVQPDTDSCGTDDLSNRDTSSRGKNPELASIKSHEELEAYLAARHAQGRKSKCYVEYAKLVRDEQRQLHEKLKAMAPRTYSNLEMILQHDAKIDGMNRCTAIELFVLHEYDIDELLSLIGECQDERFSCLPRTVLGFLTLGCRHDEHGCWLYYDEPELTQVEDYLNTWFDPQRTPVWVQM